MHNPAIPHDMAQHVNDYVNTQDVTHPIEFKRVLEHFKLNEDQFNELVADAKKASTFATSQYQKAEKAWSQARQAYDDAKAQLNDPNVDMGTRATAFFTQQAAYNASVENLNVAKALIFYVFERVAHLSVHLEQQVHDKISDYSDQF